MALADMGADVIKIEAPSGDLCRDLPPHVGGESVPFMALNRDKRSIVLDLKKPESRAYAIELIGNADVLAESFRPGVMARLGLGYDAMRAIKPAPDLLLCLGIWAE